MPERQLGFRRVLAGIYTHTSAHIIAAPMAHYVAKTGSRFHYSHDTWHLPVDGLLRTVRGEKMQMTFRSVDGKQVPYHSSMHLFHRSEQLKHLCAYQFYSEMKVMGKKDADAMDKEHFEFLEQHPLHSTITSCYRDSACVPVFAWNWLGSTKEWSTPILEAVSKSDADYLKKEQYALRFMLLFLPFRSAEELTKNGSHTTAFQEAYKQNLFHPSMLQVAENIQDILNSVDAGFPDNPLNGITSLDEMEDFPESPDEIDDAENVQLAIGEYLSATSTDEMLSSDATEFNPTFVSTNSSYPALPTNQVSDVFSVIEYVPENTEKSKHGSSVENGVRFQTGISELDTLALRTVQSTETSESTETGQPKTKTIIDATGTWESIVKWGINAELDAEQHTAFEILAATYVLTFYDEATHNKSDDKKFRKNKQGLEELARRKMTRDKPLRMFITGPAGAGKCKLLILLCL